MTNLLNAMKATTNYTFTENSAVSYKSTLNPVLDMFALGGAYRQRSDEDCILLFKQALETDFELALKCLFYLRAFRGIGQGERRFFRVCYRWLAQNYPDAARRNLKFVVELGRWDDLGVLFNTPLQGDVCMAFDQQLRADAQSNTPSLCAKWAFVENCSDPERIKKARILRNYMCMTSRAYRKMVSAIRKKINLVESNMSQDRWDDIEFDKLPSKAGFKYRKAFATNEQTAERYSAFMSSKTTKVNAGTLFPYEVVNAAIKEDVSIRNTVNKYWENLTDYFNGATFDALCVCDTSGSMRGYNAAAPINVAISIAMYCAERNKGPFYNHYISFSSHPQLIEIKGIDFVDKVKRIYDTNLCENTDLEATFELILNTIIKNNLSQEDIPENIIIISDMEWDSATSRNWWVPPHARHLPPQTLIETVSTRWEQFGLKLPKLIFWNVNARDDLIPALGAPYTYISGCNPTIFTQLMTGKTGIDLMLETLNSPQFKDIH